MYVCLFYLLFYLFIFLLIYFLLYYKVLEFGWGQAFSVVDYVLLVVVGCVLVMWVFQWIFVMDVGCIQNQTQTQTLSPLPYEKNSNQLAWIENSSRWLGGLLFALLPYYPSFFVTVYCLGLYDGDSIFCLFCLIRTWLPRLRSKGFIFWFLSAYYFIISFPFELFPAIRSCIGLGAGFLGVSGRQMFIFCRCRLQNEIFLWCYEGWPCIALENEVTGFSS